MEFLGPIAWQIRELADEGFVLDSVLNVVDCQNFEGYADNSYTAQLQAKYTDLVLLTKHEGVCSILFFFFFPPPDLATL